jgi:tetratricopeptide (TPR) repeat protein
MLQSFVTTAWSSIPLLGTFTRKAYGRTNFPRWVPLDHPARAFLNHNEGRVTWHLIDSKFFRVLLAALLLSACSSPPNPTEPLPPAQLEAAQRAKKHFEHGNYREAEKIYEGILAAVPDNLHTLTNLGVVRLRSGKFKPAEEVLRRALTVAPSDAFCHCTLGIVYYSEKRFDEAIQSLKRAIEIAPRNATAHSYLGICYAQKGMQKEAALELEIVRELDPNYREADALPNEVPDRFQTNEA